MTKEKQVFLIQSSGYKPAEHHVVNFEDRSYAEEVLKHNYYRHEGWHKKVRDQDFGKVRTGDHVLLYCTGNVDESPSQIKFIYEVIALENIPEEELNNAVKEDRITTEEARGFKERPHILRLKLHSKLRRGLELHIVRGLVGDGKLSENMNNCGKLGFNICQVSYDDYNAIIDWDKQAPPPPIAIEPYEEELRTYLRDRPLGETVGASCTDYELYEDEKGRTGELYRTPIGEIDLLYLNKQTGNFLVIELKRTSDTSDSAVGQIARYIGWVKENLAKDKKVFGLLIVHSASEELKYAVKSLKDCDLFAFRVEFILSKV